MATYCVTLMDKDGCTICTDDIDGLNAACDRARYWLTDLYAERLETTHEALGTHKVQVERLGSSRVVFDDFR